MAAQWRTHRGRDQLPANDRGRAHTRGRGHGDAGSNAADHHPYIRAGDRPRHRERGARVDARRGEIYYAFYRHVPGGVQRVSEYLLGAPDDLAAEIVAAGEECLVVGDGPQRYPESFAHLTEIEFGEAGNRFPSPEALVEIAHPRALREEFVPVWDIHAMYLRKADAEINWETRAGV